MAKDILQIENLNCDTVTAMPIDVSDFSPDSWMFFFETDESNRSYGAVECEACGALLVDVCGNDRHCGIDDESECDGYVASAEGPMMNFAYPIPRQDDIEESARKIAHLPLCLVELNDEHYLALTGGGMDLSWEICEAHIRLGLRPPVHFCDLPAMCGRGESENDLLIIEACKESCKIAARWATGTIDRLDNLRIKAGA